VFYYTDTFQQQYLLKSPWFW